MPIGEDLSVEPIPGGDVPLLVEELYMSGDILYAELLLASLRRDPEFMKKHLEELRRTNTDNATALAAPPSDLF
jgi:hypothetical protein